MILPEKKAVFSLLLPEVKEILKESLGSCYFHTGDKKTLDVIRIDFEEKFRNWVKDIIDLKDFNFAYPIHGVTGAIEQWLLDNPNDIYQLPGEYGWIKIQRPWAGKNVKPFDTAYCSNPFSATGCFHEKYLDFNLPTFLDCAFIGSTPKKKINLSSNIELIAFGLSKGFGVNLFRTGIMFSKKPISAFEIWNGFNYYNFTSLKVAKTIIENFEIDYIYEKFKDVQAEVCVENNLTPSDCVFLATSSDKKYDFYKREDGTNRLCLSLEYAKRGYGTFYTSEI